MKLIIDSGSTKADGVIHIKKNKISSFTILGMNPFFISDYLIEREFQSKVFKKINKNRITDIFFYGAGCGDIKEKNKILNVLSSLIPEANIEINTDLLGAARSIYQDKQGIVAILGTGANSGIYDGRAITENIRPLGYVLGDEGSGAWFGKELLKLYFHNELTEELNVLFENKCNTNKNEILRKIYTSELPNRYIASFFSFIEDNLSHPFIKSLCYEGIDKFFKYYIEPYNKKENPISFSGSVSFVLKDFIKEYSLKNGYNLMNIYQSAMNGLVKFHFKAK